MGSVSLVQFGCVKGVDICECIDEGGEKDSAMPVSGEVLNEKSRLCGGAVDDENDEWDEGIAEADNSKFNDALASSWCSKLSASGTVVTLCSKAGVAADLPLVFFCAIRTGRVSMQHPSGEKVSIADPPRAKRSYSGVVDIFRTPARSVDHSRVPFSMCSHTLTTIAVERREHTSSQRFLRARQAGETSRDKRSRLLSAREVMAHGDNLFLSFECQCGFDSTSGRSGQESVASRKR